MIDNKEFRINIGSLSSYSSLYNNLAPSLSYLRKLYANDKLPEKIYFDFRYIERKRIKISALTYLLSVSHNISRIYKRPFDVIINWDPYILSFLHDLDFISIANYFRLYDWEGYIGGYKSGQFNPNSKLFYFEEINSIFNFSSKIDLDRWKEECREDIEIELEKRFEKILLIQDLDREYNIFLIDKLISTTAELIVNTLLHGQEICFMGIQRTSKGISISISDSGLGLIDGLKNFRKWAQSVNLKEKYIDFEIKNDIDALLNAALIKENDVGLKSAIDDIINDLNGYVTMSTGLAEIRWETQNWNIASQRFDYDNFHKNLQSANDLLGEEKKGFMSKSDYYKGYYQIHKNYLKGTRISFEVPFVTNLLRK